MQARSIVGERKSTHRACCAATVGNARIIIAPVFLDALEKCPKAVRKKAREFIKRFPFAPISKGSHYEKIEGAKDPQVRTVRIGLGYRAILLQPAKGDDRIIVWIDHHDEAIEWARERRFQIGAISGQLANVEIAPIESQPISAPTRESTPVDQMPSPPIVLPPQPAEPSHHPTVPPTADDFREELHTIFATAQRPERPSIDVNAGELHRRVGGYPGPNHRMPACCNVMRSSMKSGDQILRAPPNGKGASLVIRYQLPR
jgi:5-methylcytosine-specific restriction protein A